MSRSRLDDQLKFIAEIDKLKSVMRRCYLADGTRLENTAEHSWHFALMTNLFAEHADEPGLDLAKVMHMALVHDLVEIDAGDTYCYDEKAHCDKEEREIAAAKRIFGLLPDDQGATIWNLWQEFEKGKSAEAKYARALDRLNPFLLNFWSNGASWQKNAVKKSQVLKRMGEIKENLPKLWPTVSSIIDQGIANGWLIDDLKI